MKTKMMKKRILLLLLALTMLLTCAACGSKEDPTQQSSQQVEETSTDESNETESSSAVGTVIDKDREGNPIILPATINTIISMGPSNTEILSALGCGDMIKAADEYSVGIEGVSDDIPHFSMMTPDGEQMIQLQPDVIFVTGMSKTAGDDPFQVVEEGGICIIYIPSSTSIDGIKEDIRFIAEVMGKPTEGEAIIADMEKEIADIKAIGDTITDKKSVYFEIGAAPSMYSLGTGTFLNEMIEIIGAENVFGDQESWISVTDEVILDVNPDVILTSVNYIDNPVDEIKSRAGWDVITAVQEDAVYIIDTDASNRPSHNIVKALREMAAAIYPEYHQ